LGPITMISIYLCLAFFGGVLGSSSTDPLLGSETEMSRTDGDSPEPKHDTGPQLLDLSMAELPLNICVVKCQEQKKLLLAEIRKFEGMDYTIITTLKKPTTTITKTTTTTTTTTTTNTLITTIKGTTTATTTKNGK